MIDVFGLLDRPLRSGEFFTDAMIRPIAIALIGSARAGS